jgi:hypothetical protein
VFGSSWRDADCQFSPGTNEFAYTDSKGKQQRVEGSWILDVESRSGKKQHQFDVHSSGSTVISLAAGTEEEKQKWTTAIMTAAATAMDTITMTVAIENFSLNKKKRKIVTDKISEIKGGATDLE